MDIMGIATALLDLNTVSKETNSNEIKNNDKLKPKNVILQEFANDSNNSLKNAFKPLPLPLEIQEAININNIHEINEEINHNYDFSTLFSISNYNTPKSSPGTSNKVNKASSKTLKSAKPSKIRSYIDHTPKWRNSENTTLSASSKRQHGKRKINVPHQFEDFQMISQPKSKLNKRITTTKIKSSKVGQSSSNNKRHRVDGNYDMTTNSNRISPFSELDGSSISTASITMAESNAITIIDNPDASPVCQEQDQSR